MEKDLPTKATPTAVHVAAISVRFTQSPDRMTLIPERSATLNEAAAASNHAVMANPLRRLACMLACSFESMFNIRRFLSPST